MRGRVKVAFGHEPWWVEIWSGTTMVGWGLYLLLRPDALQMMESFPGLAKIGLNPAWISITIPAGLFQLSVTVMNLRKARWGAAMIAMSVWLLLSVAISTSDLGVPPSITVFAGWAAANAISVVRLLRPAPKIAHE